jgi:hypothetical protein
MQLLDMAIAVLVAAALGAALTAVESRRVRQPQGRPAARQHGVRRPGAAGARNGRPSRW